MPVQWLRYADLVNRGILNNRQTLKNWIKQQGFPAGRLIGPNSRAWSAVEIERWLDSRPVNRRRLRPKASAKPGSTFFKKHKTRRRFKSLHGNRNDAIADAEAIASGFGVAVQVAA
jgi:hypothetical protein